MVIRSDVRSTDCHGVSHRQNVFSRVDISVVVRSAVGTVPVSDIQLNPQGVPHRNLDWVSGGIAGLFCCVLQPSLLRSKNRDEDSDKATNLLCRYT